MPRIQLCRRVTVAPVMKLGCTISRLSLLIFLWCGACLVLDTPVLIHAKEFVGQQHTKSDGRGVGRIFLDGQGEVTTEPAVTPDGQCPTSISMTRASSWTKRATFNGLISWTKAHNNLRLSQGRRQQWQRSGKYSAKDYITWTSLSGGADEESNTSSVDDAKGSRSGAFLGNIDTLRRRSLEIPEMIIQKKDPILQRMKAAADVVQQAGSRAIPSAMTTLTVLYVADRGISAATMYALALLGAACGFHLFLYFITIGYALGIGLPLLVALCVYNKHSKLPRATLLHSFLTLMWSARMFTFFIYREYVSWPALHEKVVEIQKRMTIPFASRLLCWVVYSFFYLAMTSMSWGRLQQGAIAKWGLVGRIGLLMQGGGLLLETIADLQKNGFKSRNRHAWCNVGVWKWSTHPNYLGEGTFWVGAYLGHGFYSVPRTLVATVGLGFILQVLRGSTKSLARKHVEKYGDQPEFFEFHRTHSIWGSKQWWWWLHGMEQSSKESPVAIPSVLTMGNATNTANVTAAFDTTTSVVEVSPPSDSAP